MKLQVPERVRNFLTTARFEAIMRLIVVLSITMSLVASYQVLKLNTCLAKSLQTRDAAAQADRAVTDKLMLAVSTAKSAADTRAALDEYLSTRARTDKERAAHPYPVPGSSC
jgi:hypothetical protein